MTRLPLWSMALPAIGDRDDLVIVFPDPGTGAPGPDLADGHAHVFHQPAGIACQADVIGGGVAEPADAATGPMVAHATRQATRHCQMGVEPGADPVEFARMPVVGAAQAAGVVEGVKEAQMRTALAAPIGRNETDIHGSIPQARRDLSLKRGKAGARAPSGSGPDGWLSLCGVRLEGHHKPHARRFRDRRDKRSASRVASQLTETQCWFAVSPGRREGRV